MLSLLLLPFTVVAMWLIIKDYRQRNRNPRSKGDERLVAARRMYFRFVAVFMVAFVLWGSLKMVAIPTWLNIGLEVIWGVAGLGVAFSAMTVADVRNAR